MSSQMDEEAQFKEIMSQNELLMKENMLLREYLNRHTPGFGDVDAHNIEQAERAFIPSDEKHRESSDAKAESRHRSNRPVAGSVLKGKKDASQAVLTLTQKMNILQEELSVRSKELVEIDTKAAKDVADLNAMMGETTIRVNELKKEAYEFRRDIVLGGEATRAKKVSAEKVIKYFEDKIRLKEQLIEKIKLKNQSLKNQIAKLDAQLRQKEEQGDSLHSIDFHQLKIENSLFNTRIAEKNSELLSLKTTTGKTVQVLNSVKRNLQNLLQEQARIKGEIAQHQDALIRLTEELSKVEEIVSKADKVNRKLKAVDSNSAALPQVMEYVGYAAQLHDLQSQRQNWIRKVEIAEMALRRKKTQARKAQTTAQ